MSRRLSETMLKLGKPCPVKRGKPDQELYLDSTAAAARLGIGPSTLSAAALKGELTLFHHAFKAYWSIAQLDQWGSKEGRAARATRRPK